jgi:competence protein ComEC
MKAKRNFRVVLIFLIVWMVVLLLSIQSKAASTTLKASYINVGQGDSILLRDGNGYTVLIDGGDTGKGPTVAAYLHAQGENDINVMVNTHPDSDHVGGLVDLLKMADITVEAVVNNGYVGTTTTWKNFATQVAIRGLQFTPAQYPETFTWGAMNVSILNPQPGLSNPDTNNASVVLLINHGEVKFLFTGDIDSTQEAKVVALGTPVAADILKVAHHGSNYSTGADFLAAVAPTDAIISVGTNSYGHPGTDTLNRLLAIGALIWRTDQNGTIVVQSDGVTYTINGAIYIVYLPLIMRQEITPSATMTFTLTTTNTPPLSATMTPTFTTTNTPSLTATILLLSDLRITTLSGTSTPEYVIIENFGAGAQNMTGWRLVSVVGPQTFNFPSGYVLNPGATVRIESYTGATNNPPATLLWSLAAIWNNSGDKAELRNASNGLVSSICYGSGCP